MSDKCNACGKPITWARTDLQVSVPLDPAARVYKIEKQFGRDVARLDHDSMVAHSSVCRPARPPVAKKLTVQEARE